MKIKNHRPFGAKTVDSYLGATQQEKATLGYKIAKTIVTGMVGTGIYFGVLFGIGFAQGTVDAIRNWNNLEGITQTAEPNQKKSQRDSEFFRLFGREPDFQTSKNNANQISYPVNRESFHGDYRGVR